MNTELSIRNGFPNRTEPKNLDFFDKKHRTAEPNIFSKGLEARSGINSRQEIAYRQKQTIMLF